MGRREPRRPAPEGFGGIGTGRGDDPHAAEPPAGRPYEQELVVLGTGVEVLLNRRLVTIRWNDPPCSFQIPPERVRYSHIDRFSHSVLLKLRVRLGPDGPPWSHAELELPFADDAHDQLVRLRYALGHDPVPPPAPTPPPVEPPPYVPMPEPLTRHVSPVPSHAPDETSAGAPREALAAPPAPPPQPAEQHADAEGPPPEPHADAPTPERQPPPTPPPASHENPPTAARAPQVLWIEPCPPADADDDPAWLRLRAPAETRRLLRPADGEPASRP